jgi:hypothetical protein
MACSRCLPSRQGGREQVAGLGDWEMVHLTLVRGMSTTGPWPWVHISPPSSVQNEHQMILLPGGRQ